MLLERLKDYVSQCMIKVIIKGEMTGLNQGWNITVYKTDVHLNVENVLNLVQFNQSSLSLE